MEQLWKPVIILNKQANTAKPDVRDLQLQYNMETQHQQSLQNKKCSYITPPTQSVSSFKRYK